jgi:hypothetical protein
LVRSNVIFLSGIKKALTKTRSKGKVKKARKMVLYLFCNGLIKYKITEKIIMKTTAGISHPKNLPTAVVSSVNSPLIPSDVMK